MRWLATLCYSFFIFLQHVVFAAAPSAVSSFISNVAPLYASRYTVHVPAYPGKIPLSYNRNSGGTSHEHIFKLASGGLKIEEDGDYFTNIFVQVALSPGNPEKHSIIYLVADDNPNDVKLVTLPGSVYPPGPTIISLESNFLTIKNLKKGTTLSLYVSHPNGPIPLSVVTWSIYAAKY